MFCWDTRRSMYILKTRRLDCWARSKGKLSLAAKISSSVLSSYQCLDFYAGLRHSIIWSRLADRIAFGEGKAERTLKAVGLHKWANTDSNFGNRSSKTDRNRSWVSVYNVLKPSYWRQRFCNSKMCSLRGFSFGKFIQIVNLSNPIRINGVGLNFANRFLFLRMSL